MSDRPVILAIDDDPTILNIVFSVLKEEYTVHPFTSGQAAISFLTGRGADLILLDQHMPGMDGFEVLGQLQSAPTTRSIPIIFHTGDNGGSSEVEALEMGAVDYIRKPVRPRKLLTRVRLQIELQAYRKKLEELVEEKNRSLNDAYTKLKAREEVTLNLLARVTDMRDQQTGNHVERTTVFVSNIVEFLLAHPQPGYRLTLFEAEDIIRSAKLHDLGKIAIPDTILLKNGRLTEGEFNRIKEHTVHGEELLSEFSRRMDDSFLNTARDIAYSHHEKWDGSGYPQGLKGDNIPLSARIVAIADVYDALTSTRPYKKAFSPQEARDIVIEESGTHFDPHLVRVFLRCEEAFAAVVTRQTP